MSFEKALNPRGYEHPYARGVAIGLGTFVIAGVHVTGWLHRGIHGGVKYSDGAKKILRKTNLMVTGMAQTDWVTHLAHHAYPDTEDRDAWSEWNEERPEGAPEAPIEAFRDPYSVILDGYRRVKFDTSGLHRKSKLAILPWLHELNNFDKQNHLIDREHWPEAYRNVDLDKEGDPTKLRNKAAYAGLIATGAIIAIHQGPKTTAAWAATHVPMLLQMGGVINADAHTGQEGGFINRAKVVFGLQEPVADKEGELAANLLTGIEGLFGGEFHHQYHHKNPSNPYLAGDGRNPLRDPPGVAIRLMARLGLATTPGAPD